MSFLRGFLASPEQANTPNEVETIERLCDRLETATLLDDRRDAIRALKSLSKKYQVEVGTHAMEMLMNVVREDASDSEITEMVLETLLNVMSSKGEIPSGEDLGVQFTEMFLKNEENIPVLLTLLEEYEFHVRWPTVKLIILLLKNKSKDLQERVLVSPMAISRLMDLLSDSREIIRNDGLLLMIKLTKNNPSIQKIVAFENAFERIFHILTVEGYSDGGVIVEDCLNLLLNLLRNNASNQNFFRETSNIQRIAPFFDMTAADTEEGEEEEEEEEMVWSVQKQNNILLMLDTVQILVNPLNNPQSVTSSQKVLYTRGVFMKLMDMLLSPSIPREVFARLLCTIGNIIRGNELIQQFMDELEMSDREAIVLILMLMVNDKQTFSTRISALYCVQCFLFKNPKGQASIVTTLLPNQDSVNTSVTSGQLLCAGLFSTDPVAHWLCCVVLAHCLLNNSDQHENLLLVQLELVPGEPPIFLINHAFSILHTEKHPQTRLGLLMLLTQWVNESPSVVGALLQLPKFIPLLLELIENKDAQEEASDVQGAIGGILLGLCFKYNDDSCSQYTKSTLQHLITQRVGLDDFRELLDSMLIKPQFITASKTPQPSPNDTLALDYAFTKLYKKLTDVIMKSLEGDEENEQDQNIIETHDLIVTGYKDLIKDQDEEITKLKGELENTKQNQAVQNEQLQKYAKDQETYYQQYIQQLQTWYTDQMSTAAQQQTSGPPLQPSTAQGDPSQGGTGDQCGGNVAELEDELNRLRMERQQQDQKVGELVAQLEQSHLEETKRLHNEAPKIESMEHESHHQQIASYQTRVLDLEREVEGYKSTIDQLEEERLTQQGQIVELKSRASEVELLLVGERGKSAEIEAFLEDERGNSARLVREKKEVEMELRRDVKRLNEDIALLKSQVEQTIPVDKQNIVTSTNEEPQQEGADQPKQNMEPKQYLYDYSSWFQEVQSPDGITYYQAADGNVYNYEQYLYLIEQYDAYYRAQEQEQEQQGTQEQEVKREQQGTQEQEVNREQEGTQEEHAQEQQAASLEHGADLVLLQGEVETLRELNSKLTAEIESKNAMIEGLETKVTVMENKSGRSQQLSKSEVKTEVIERGLLTRSEMKTLAVDCPGDDVARDPSDVTRYPSDVTRDPSDVTRDPSDVTRDPSDVTRDPSDVTRGTGDVKSSRTDDESTAEMSDRDMYKEKFENLAAEQEDLLILLAHQDKDITTLKERLRSLGEIINSSSSDDDDDDFDDLLDVDLPEASELTTDGRLQ